MALNYYALFRPIHNIFLKGNKISGFEINHERASLCILGDFGIMKWKGPETLWQKTVHGARSRYQRDLFRIGDLLEIGNQ